jgi:hypothetical protein
VISSGAAVAFETGINASKVINSANMSDELVILDKNERGCMASA